MEEDEEGTYDDITKYDEASSEDEQSGVVTEEPTSDKGPSEYVPGKPLEEKTEFAKAAANGYDSMNKTEVDSSDKNEVATTKTTGSESGEQKSVSSDCLLDKSE